MLAGLLGVRLLLLVGKTVPLPASYELMKAITNVEVTNDDQSGDGFQITFSIAKEKIPDYSLLLSGALEPFNRVIIAILLGAFPEVLMDGIITHRQLIPSEDLGKSTLVVTGKDVSVMLDLKEKNEKYENQPDFLIAMRLIVEYAQYGLIPQITPTTDVPVMLQRIPRQQETDLKFIRRLADRNGFVFYIEPVTVGVNTAYWGPENRLSFPQPALSINMGPSSNVNSLSFSQDNLAPVATEGSFVEPFLKTSIPIPQLPSLRIPPLALMPVQAKRTVLMRDTANQNPAQAAVNTLAAASRVPDAVTGQGELDFLRYGRVLRARKLVGVRGVGFSYDGIYYVHRVTHNITPGSYKQRFTLSREGTGSLLPALPA